MAYFFLGVLTVVNMFMFRAAGLQLLGERVLRVYATFIFVAYTLRGWSLLIFEPRPVRNSSFAIRNLYYPNYATTLSDVIPFVIGTSVLVYAALLLVAGSSRKDLGSFSQSGMYRVSYGALAALYALGTLLRIAAPGVGDGALLRFGSMGQAFCAVVIATYLLVKDWRSDGRLVRYSLALYLLCEFGWGIALASKTPILAVLLLLYLDINRGRISKRVAAIAMVVITLTFTSLQELKESANEIEGDSIIVRAFYSITGRIDGLYALAGAYVRGPGEYRFLRSPFDTVLSSFLPSWGYPGEKTLAGLRWGQEVYRSTTSVSYAEGLPAEGLAIAGVLGPPIWGLIGGILIGLVVRSVSSSSRIVQMTALAMVGSTVMFERGLLGMVEQLGATLQAAILMAIALWVMSPRDRDKSKSKSQSGDPVDMRKQLHRGYPL